MIIPRHATVYRPARAFTLIELLAVIAIIGILAAIIIPVVGKVRETAKGAQCKSNLRQIGVGIALYAQENGGMYPYGIKQVGTIRWSHEIQNYMASTTGKNKPGDMFVCPGESVRLKEQSGSYVRNTNYIANPNVLGDDRGDPNTPRKRLENISRPTSVILVADSAVDVNGACDWGFFNQTGVSSISPGNAEKIVPDETKLDGGAGKRLSWRHNGSVQAVFVDGHVGAFSAGDLKYQNMQISY
ncbi:MAG: prepilin-type N-terminal cleavage/methylation domain-containing protein [Opitutaceae bacterium]|jgi:prepilin-type N-terminal cleavage/methylation domain-containing protein/prepilin-type processing-associated H-X9-DG protein|nr:prepilin-type N-terminal cleavage/methylation domain-containing protein [Opitutaceae bacterium]